MNANANNVTSFQQVLPGADAGPGRRRRIGQVELRQEALDGFNGLLSSLGWRAAPLTLDQVATAARALSPGQGTTPTYIHVQMERGRQLAEMLADHSWEPANDAVATARSITGYLERDRGLIPNRVPGLGRLDDAVLIETAWPRLAAEVSDFHDFRRIRRIEAALRGASPEHLAFGRGDWLEARRAEAVLREQQRILRGRFRAQVPMPLFRIG